MAIAEQPSKTKQEILEYLLKHTQAKAQDLANALSISPQAIRRHLKELEWEGLIEYQSVQEKMGRPQHIYRLSNKGKERFPNQYGEFAVSFLDNLAKVIGVDQVSSVLKKQWEQKAQDYRVLLGSGDLADRMAKLVELRQIEGYMADFYIVQDNPNQFIFTEHHCAISNVAESFPKVCDHELEMFAMILPDCLVERTHWMINGEHRCGYLIQKRVVH